VKVLRSLVRRQVIQNPDTRSRIEVELHYATCPRRAGAAQVSCAQHIAQRLLHLAVPTGKLTSFCQPAPAAAQLHTCNPGGLGSRAYMPPCAGSDRVSSDRGEQLIADASGLYPSLDPIPLAATTDSGHQRPIAPKLLQHKSTASVPNRVWMADMTYMDLLRLSGERFGCYLVSLSN
jgi:hypothetical protein